MKKWIIAILLIMLVLVIVVGIGVYSVMHKGSSKSAGKAGWLKLELAGAYPEHAREEMPALFGGKKPRSFLSLLQALEAAKSDKNIEGMIIVNPKEYDMGFAQFEELLKAVRSFKASGKPVWAYLDDASTREYLLAAQADQIYLNPAGAFILPGMQIRMVYLGGAMEKLGIKWDIVRAGKYKDAMEPLAEKTWSKETQESYGALMDDIYNIMVGEIAQGRKLSEQEVTTAIDRSLFLPSQALASKLIDKVDYYRNTLEAIKKSNPKLAADEDDKTLPNLISINEYIADKGHPHKGDKSLALVYCTGTIVGGESGRPSPWSSDRNMGAATIVATLEKVARDKEIKAVLLRVDSPGGSALASDQMWKAIENLKASGKKVVVSMGNVAASGGYYISMNADKIFCDAGTITGSIGVIFGKPTTKGMWDKLGVNMPAMQRGKQADLFSTYEPLRPDQRELLTEMIETTYAQFVGKAAEGRHQPYAQLEPNAQGRVWMGVPAKRLGLVDTLGGLTDAIAFTKKIAGIAEGKDVDFKVYPKSKSMFEEISESFGAEMRTRFFSPEEREILDMVTSTRAFGKGGVMAWFPYKVAVE